MSLSKIGRKNALIQKFTPTAEFSIPRGNHGCGTFVGDGGVEFVVAGGITDDEDTLDSVEIYNVNTDTWRAGNPLPRRLSLAKDSILLTLNLCRSRTCCSCRKMSFLTC